MVTADKRRGDSKLQSPALPSDDARTRVLLLAAGSAPEHEVLRDWIERERAQGDGGRVETLDVRSAKLADRLEQGDDPLMCPVGVSWLPPEHRGQRRARVRHLLFGRDPWHPSPRAQRRILRDAPDRCEVVVGDPAPVSDLRERFDRRPGGSFADFVRRQAALTLERAERAIVGVQYKVPHLVQEEITDTTAFCEDAAALADRLGLPRDEVLKRATEALSEMVASQRRAAIDVWDQFGRFLARAHRIEVDDDRVAQLRELGRRHSLVFLPSHRSYLDPLVLRPALLGEGLPPNHVIGGLNVSFWPVGPITRRSSYVFIRRKMRGDDVYKWTLQRYLAYLVRKRFNLEWYIEGGRSRTGKLRPPRFGILSYLVNGVREHGGDPYLVPTSITYEQLHEAGEMTAQARGAAKDKEDLGWLVGYARSQGRGLGRVHVRFGEPLRLREALGGAAALDAADDAVRRAVQRTGIEVCHRINTATPVTETALVALALLGSQQRALTRDQLLEAIEALREYAVLREVKITGYADAALPALQESGVVECYDGGGEPVYRIAAEQHLLAAFYANSAVHVYVVRAIAEVAQHAEDPMQAALALRDLLKFEFFFAAREPFCEEIADLMEKPLRPLVAPRVLRPIVEAYVVAAEQLVAVPAGAAADRDTLTEVGVGLARQRLLQGRIASPDAISSELLGTALDLADNRGLLDARSGAGRTALRDELVALCDRLQAMASLEHAG